MRLARISEAQRVREAGLPSLQRALRPPHTPAACWPHLLRRETGALPLVPRLVMEPSWEELALGLATSRAKDRQGHFLVA